MAGSEQIPDPSSLTTAALARENAMFREILDARLSAFEARLAGMDKALERAEKFPTAIDSAVKGLKELYDEKFRGIDAVFSEREKRANQQAVDTKTAVDAAFKAQTEAAAKTEKSFSEQIAQTANLLNTKTDGLQTQMNDVKLRQVTGETVRTTTKDVATDGRALVFSVVGIVIGIGSLLVAIVIAIMTRQPTA